jgi:threonine synthase
MEEAERNERVVFEKEIHEQFSRGFLTSSISDEETAQTMSSIYKGEGYLLDPHAAVAVAAANKWKDKLAEGSKVLCLATAHPSKFPEVVKNALQVSVLPDEAIHPSLEDAKNYCQKVYECDYKDMHTTVPRTMRATTVTATNKSIHAI